jgi:hypothetical protein
MSSPPNQELLVSLTLHRCVKCGHLSYGRDGWLQHGDATDDTHRWELVDVEVPRAALSSSTGDTEGRCPTCGTQILTVDMTHGTSANVPSPSTSEAGD